MKKNIQIKDFNLFVAVVRAATKLVDSAKFTVTETGLEIYGARAKAARCELVSNAIYSDEPVSFAIESLNLFLKVLTTVKEVHEGDYSNFKFIVDLPHLRFESKKFKTKYGTQNENIITQWIGKKVETVVTPIFEFTTTSDMIKRINSHSFIFTNPETVRVYLETKSDMENNALFATIGNRESNLNNEMTFKFGLITLNTLGDTSIVVDQARLNMFNAVQSDNIVISRIKEKACLVSKTKITGENDTYFNLSVYSTLLKA